MGALLQAACSNKVVSFCGRHAIVFVTSFCHLPQYEKDNNAWKKLQMLIMQLRKCCNHPCASFPWLCSIDEDVQRTRLSIAALTSTCCRHSDVFDPMPQVPVPGC